MKRTCADPDLKEFIPLSAERLTNSLRYSVRHVKNDLREPIDSDQGKIFNLKDYSVTPTFVKPPRKVYREQDLEHPLFDWGWGHLEGMSILNIYLLQKIHLLLKKLNFSKPHEYLMY